MEKVYKDKEYCSGCGACVEICPQNAISMQYDEAGFLYPLIDKKICIDCEACSKMCSFRNTVKHTNSKCFAGVNIDVSQMMKSTSAGIFAGIASEFLRDGLVCGAEMKYQKNNSDLTLQNIVVEHTLVKDVRELIKLQGSKYVQSNLYACLDELKQALKNGEKVLFSGTPCQVASVKSLFSKYVGTQLYTIDIICHGVPNQQILNDYLIMFQKVHEVTLKELIFRDKQYGWRLDGKIVAVKPNNEKFEFKFSPKNSSFYRFFWMVKYTATIVIIVLMRARIGLEILQLVITGVLKNMIHSY